MGGEEAEYSRLGVYLIQKTSSIVFGENARKTPRLLIQGLNILDFQNQNIAWLRCLNVERASQVVDLREINIAHVVSAVIVANLTACPVYAFNLDDFVVLDGSDRGN